MGNNKQDYLGRSAVKGKPQKGLKFNLSEQALSKVAAKAREEVAPDLNDLQNQVDSIQIHGMAVSNEFGDDPHIGISQKKLTESKDSLQNQINAIIADVSSLEDAVGTGGSVDSRIATAKSEIIGNATTDYNTLGKVESKLAPIEEIVDDCAYIGENDGSAVIADFDPQTDTVWKKAQTLSVTEKTQVQQNIGIREWLNNLTGEKFASYTATDQTTAVTQLLPATGATDTIYRVGMWDGSAYNQEYYSDYAWDGIVYVQLNKKSIVGEVFDISEYHAEQKYDDLEDALGTGGANVPVSVRKGGMSVKFVLNSDNKYVQFRLMTDEFSTTPANWQGVDEEPTAGSDNLVKSGGVKNAIDGIVEILNVNDTFNHPAVFTTKFDAYAAVTSSYRKKGLYITYLYNSGASGEVDHWVTEQFVGNIETEWGNSSKWAGKDTVIEQTMYTEALAAIPAWVANTPYVVGNQVTNSGKYYFCKTATSGDSEFPASKFDEITTFEPKGTKLLSIMIGSKNFDVLSNLIHIKGFGSFDLAPNIGDIFYHSSSHRLLIRRNAQGSFGTIPYSENITVECDGNFYKWNGSDLILANSQKFNVADIDTSLTNPNSNSKVLSEKAVNDLVVIPLNQIMANNLLYTSYLEQGTINDDGSDASSTTRVRFSNKIAVPFSIKLKDGYSILKAYFYDKTTGTFVSSEGMTGRQYNCFLSDGTYGVRLLIAKGTTWSEIILPTEDIIDYILPYTKEKADELLGIDYIPLLEGGGINYVTGVNESNNANVRFANKITRPFSISLKSDFNIYQVSLYNREDGSFIRSFYASSNTKVYKSDGEYGVRLVFRGTNSAKIVSYGAGTVIDSFGDAINDISSSLYTETATYCTINDMPDAARKKFAILTTTPNGPIWSDKSVWRFMKDNLLAVTAKSYAVMSLDDDTIINEHSKDEVHTLYSATKLMTAVITCQYVNDLTTSVTVIQGDIPVGEEDNESVNVGDVITYEGLLKNMIIPSDNVAPSVLSRCVGYIINPSAASDADARNAFYTAMQQKATALGMSNTTYPGAISTGQSSAADICKLLKYIYNNESDITALWGLLTASVTITGTNARTYTVSSTTTEFARTLIPEFVGGKTGTGGQGDNAEGVYAIIFQSVKDSKYYALCLMACKPANNQRFIDTRHIIDESYEA